MLKASFVDPDSFLVDGTKPEQTILDSLQGKAFTFDTKSKKLDFILAGKPEMTVSLVKKKMFIEVYEQKAIIFMYVKDGSNSHKKIVLELNGATSDLQVIKKILTKRNQFLYYRGSLALDPSCLERPSYFSYENNNLDLRGFFNLAILLMFANNFFLIFDNFLKYGFLIKENVSSGMTEFVKVSINPIDHAYYIASFGLGWFYMIAYAIEYMSYGRRISNHVRILLEVCLITALLSYPVVLQLTFGHITVVSMLSLNMLTLITTLKLISFFIVVNEMNDFLHIIRKSKVTEENKREFFSIEQISDENLDILMKGQTIVQIINVKHYLYYIFMPTLCFQLRYPRTSSIRIGWLLKRILEFTVSMMLFFYIIAQYIMPNINNAFSKIDYQSDNLLAWITNVLRLALPNTACWIISFFAFFQFFMNILAELTYFADRQFYKEWWNCKDMGEYWRLWNLPVHNWFVRHMYNPMIKRNFPQGLSSLLIFFVSAIAHEYVISVAMMRMSYWVFLAMFMQYFIIMWENFFFKYFKLTDSQFGNFSFWISFCIVGQPALIVAYYADYISLFGVPSLPTMISA